MRHSVLFATAFATLISTQTFAADLPGKGITVNPVQSTITEETFQTLLVSRALEKLGYTVNKPSEVDYNVGYTSLASGDATFTAVNWTPLHDNMYEAAGGDKKFYREGVFVNGAAQGYLIDKKTADQYKITNIAQLKDPKIAKLFDTNGDGKADLTGCNPGWGCEGAINHQLAAYELTNTVTHNQGNYAAMMADTISEGNRSCAVFEGFFDLLSFKQYAREHPEMPALGKLDVCVLNSTAIVDRSKDFLSKYEKVHAFLDNDAPGRGALEKIRSFLPEDVILVNESERLYPRCNDFNEFLQKTGCSAAGHEI